MERIGSAGLAIQDFSAPTEPSGSTSATPIKEEYFDNGQKKYRVLT